MFQRVAILLATGALTASCMAGGGAPLPSCPMPAVSSLSAPPAAVAAGPVRSWRAVLVAGDDSSPAFDNGIGTLRERLAAQGVRDISTLSASGGNASVTNLQAALGTNRSGGACFVYLTSHGATEGFFLRPGRCLMAPAALEEALNEGCGAAPTVVVVSACHSGTFLTDTMRQPNRIILTAAA
ncbi:MAG TPA: C13 family peptidase, partial [Stellaceae bacterium]|nr:C13 family peptidase [Stellaceae bacterium]